MADDSILEFIISLKDQLTDPHHKAAGAVVGDFKKMEDSAAKFAQRTKLAAKDLEQLSKPKSGSKSRFKTLDAELRTFDDHLKEAARDSERLERQLDKVRTKWNDPHINSTQPAGGGLLGSIMLGNLGSQGLMRLWGLTKDTLIDSLQASMSFGATSKSFEVLTGDPKRGKQLVNELRDLKQTTIMGASVYKNAQTLMGFGIGDNEVVKDLRMIGDVAMGDQERMANLTLAFAQTRASGKLMGQDLLQYINAGFNPLSVMSEKWQEFGLKKKTSVGKLKDMMSDGKISADAVTKAFEMATGEGGKFHGMMDQIGETAFGKMQKMKGNWAAFQIDLGNAIMPIAENFIQAGNDALHFLHISETIPEQLGRERMEMNSLVDSITHLNKGNDQRGRLLDMLISKYPDLFGNIDKERVKNYELLDILGRVNGEYKKRIELAALDLQIDENKKTVVEDQALATRLQAGTASWWDKMKAADRARTNGLFGHLSQEDQINALLQDADSRVRANALLERHKQEASIRATYNKAILIGRKEYPFPDEWKKGRMVAKNYQALHKELDWVKANQYNIPELEKHDWSVLQKLVGEKPTAQAPESPASANSTSSGNISGDSSASKGIVGGGKKQIIINVNKEMVSGGINITAQNIDQGINDFERKVEEVFLRVLNSANAVDG